jgi:Fe-S-cluster containining protein
MTLYTDHNGAFIQGMTNPDELRQFIHQKFTEGELQFAYEKLLADTKALARAEKIPALTALWKLLDQAYADKAPPLTCDKGCSHCCHTGVAITQLEWDGMVNAARKKGIDLGQVIERSRKTVDRVAKVLESGVDPGTVDWYRTVINQACPFLEKDESCAIHEDRPLDCRLMVAFREVCASKNLEHAQRGVLIEEAVAPTVIARLQHDQTPKFKRRRFTGSQQLRLIQHWLVLWKKKKGSRKK